MDWALEAGYAVSGTDTGHSGGTLDAAWALGHPEKIVDFGWRAIHDTAAASKAIVDDYYGNAPRHSYFSGCSDGGREALMEAQRFPKDYDGIVAGAPASDWTKLLTNAIWSEQALDPAERLAFARKTVDRDEGGAGDLPWRGWLSRRPAGMPFRPVEPRLQGGPVGRVPLGARGRGAEEDLFGRRGRERKVDLPRLRARGRGRSGGVAVVDHRNRAEAHGGNARVRLRNRLFRRYGVRQAGLAHRRPERRRRSRAADKTTAEALDATDPDLSAFKAAGGKLIQYHGWNDAAIPPQASIDYYESVATKMGGLQSIQSFYRLFMAPGMEHCGVGPGPNAVGGVFGLPSPSRDPAHDVVAALAHWVEDGAAPDFLVATRYLDNDPAKGLEAQRPWCPYPTAARFLGQGDRSEAASYACSAQP